jgi:uncharacterized membrane protein
MSHRALLGLVILSVAINLLLAGLIGGHFIKQGNNHPKPLGWALKGVSPEVRETVRPLIKAYTKDVLLARRDLRKTERRLRRVIESETMTREELTRSLSAMRESTARYHVLIHDIGVDVLLSLETDQRLKAAPYLFRPPSPQRLSDGRKARLRSKDRGYRVAPESPPE